MGGGKGEGRTWCEGQTFDIESEAHPRPCPALGSSSKTRPVRAHLPRGEDAAGFGKVESRCLVVCIESDDEGRDSERPDTATLRVLLLDPGDVPRDVLYRHRILDGQTVRLALYAGLVDEDTGVGGEAWREREREGGGGGG